MAFKEIILKGFSVLEIDFLFWRYKAVKDSIIANLFNKKEPVFPF